MSCFIYRHTTNTYLFKVNNRNTRKRYELSSNIVLVSLLLTLNTFYTSSNVSIVDFEQVNCNCNKQLQFKVKLPQNDSQSRYLKKIKLIMKQSLKMIKCIARKIEL